MTPAPTFAELMHAIFTAKESGAGVYLLLYFVILVLMTVAAFQARHSRKKTDLAFQELQRRLDDCERKHVEEKAARETNSMRTARLQTKLSIVTGMLVSSMGSRKLPEGFWKTMIEEENFPTFETAVNETAPQ